MTFRFDCWLIIDCFIDCFIIQGMEEQHYVEEIIGGDPNAVDVDQHHHQEGGDANLEGMETQQIHLDADGNAHILTQRQIGDLVTFHAVGVDSQGNYVGDGTEVEGEGGEMGEHVEIPMDHHQQDEHDGGMEGMMEADNVVEEVIAPNNQEEGYLGSENLEMEVGGQDQEQFNQYQVFNPETGTFSQMNAPVSQQQKTIIRRPVQKVQTQQQQVMKWKM